MSTARMECFVQGRGWKMKDDSLMSKTDTVLKRSLDLFGSILGLIFLSPVLFMIATCIALDSGRPVLFRQQRLGRDGKIFRIFKFRTMIKGAPINMTADGEVINDATDSRHTRIGRFLRDYSLDELPQLINVWRGEMSLIGPRPDLPDVLHMYSESEQRKLDVKPGMTGLAQIRGRNALSAKEKWAYDMQYAESATFIGDIKILLITLWSVVRRKGVYKLADR